MVINYKNYIKELTHGEKMFFNEILFIKKSITQIGEKKIKSRHDLLNSINRTKRELINNTLLLEEMINKK